jgi:hypothetical protein
MERDTGHGLRMKRDTGHDHTGIEIPVMAYIGTEILVGL